MGMLRLVIAQHSQASESSGADVRDQKSRLVEGPKDVEEMTQS